jgi:predicted Zn-dependent protease
MLLACLSLPDQLLCLEQWSYHVPNVQLIARLCSVEHELHPTSMASSQSQLAAALQTHPTSLRLWTIAIAIECAKGKVKEARWMYKEALKSIPLSSSLWTQYMKFEINQLENPNESKQLSALFDIDRNAEELGVSLETHVTSWMTSV